ncbi:diguanylate phosphodiesterase [Agarivorans sp. Toyoura001]|uniref:putative bifunctional diguanylate cyclase/phosphodiesterase n=1 Tax=Agarivorans sp. Toyoura001 TaxID=2283141 RepID=UPI0010EEFED4|nr:EAL domain-containing protein [Agarivorans sp. Toyoura001]GDY24391.1 diguanylate phosphodiesterase [Agarivorans sp. Toyoura001]
MDSKKPIKAVLNSSFSSSEFIASLSQLALALAAQPSEGFFNELLSQLAKRCNAYEAYIARFDSRAPQLPCIAYWRGGQFVQNKLSPASPKLLAAIRQHSRLTISDFSACYPDYASVQPELTVNINGYWAQQIVEQDRVVGYIAFSFIDEDFDAERLSHLCQPFIARLNAEFLQYQQNEALSLSAVAFESNEGLIITDASYRIVKVNKAFAQITGYPSSEVLGCELSAIFASPNPVFIEEVNGTVRRKGEVQRTRKNGQQYTQLETITAVHKKGSAVTHYVVCIQDISASIESEQKIQHLAFYDELTGLPNRRKLHEELSICFSRAKKQHVIGALLFIDLDHFKNINDSLGHAAGDWVLQQVANRLQDLIREGDVLARLGGDEFVLLLADLGESPPHAEQQANIVGKRLIQTISAPYPFDGQSLHIGASVGITLFPGKGQTAEDLLKQADTAMYQAKSAGRRTVMFFDDGMQRQADKRLQMNNALRNALANKELLLYFQPQHMVSTGELVGAEVLVRWQPEGKSIVSPTEFIPMAEESDLIIDIGMWVLEQSCKHMAKWQKMGLLLPELSVNVSAKQLHHPDFVDKIEELMSRYQLDSAMLNLEITESVVLGHAEDTIRKMEQLKNIGLRFSIDDFGAGYSSLSYLKRLPVDELKIDRSFIRDIPRDSRDMAIVDAVLAMANHLGFTVTAEGVETRQQLEFLKQQGCTFYQGYLSSKAIPAGAMERYIQRFQRKYSQ